MSSWGLGLMQVKEWGMLKITPANPSLAGLYLAINVENTKTGAVEGHVCPGVMVKIGIPQVQKNLSIRSSGHHR
jgi:hypothetical protein